MSSPLVLVEFLEDVERAAGIARAERARLIALTPEAMQALDDRRVDYEIWTDLAQHRVEDDLAYAGLRRMAIVRRLIDEAVAAVLPADIAEGFSFSACWPQHVMILQSAVAFRVAGLRRLIERHSPPRITYFRQRHEPAGLLWEPGETIWADVCAAAAKSLAATVEWAERDSAAVALRVRRRILRASRPGRAFFASALRAVTRRAANVVRPARRAHGPEQVAPRDGARRVLVVAGGPEMDRVLPALRDFDVWRCGEPGAPAANRISPDQSRRAAREAFGRAAAAGAFEWAGCDMVHAIEPRWTRWFETRLPKTIATFEGCRRDLARLAPAFVLHGEVGTDAGTRTLLEAAGSLKIPRVEYQWGGNYGYMQQPYLAFGELRSDLMLAYTPDVADALAHTATTAGEPLPRMRAACSLYFSELRASHAADSTAGDIVYVPSALTGPYRYGPHLYLDDAAFYRMERRIVRALATAFPGRFVVKLHPWNRLACDPLPAWIRAHGLAAEVTTASLEATVRRTAVWVLDGLATVLQQTLSVNGQVVYVDPQVARPHPSAERYIEAAVTRVDGWADDLEERLVAAVREQLRGPRRADTTEFVRRYVGTETREAARERFAGVLREIANPRRSTTHVDEWIDARAGEVTCSERA